MTARNLSSMGALVLVACAVPGTTESIASQTAARGGMGGQAAVAGAEPATLAVGGPFAFRAQVDADAATFRRGDGELGLRFSAWGRDGELEPTEPGARIVRERSEGGDLAGGGAAETELDRGAVIERWATDPAGVRQEWDVLDAPEGDGPLALRIEVELGSVGRLLGDTAALLEDSDGHTWTYASPRAWDADGVELPAWIEESDGAIVVRVDDEGANWPIHVDPVVSTATQTFAGGSGDKLGNALAGRGDLNGDGYDDIAIGAPGASSGKGQVYVYYGSSSGISSTPSATLTGTKTSGAFGFSIAMDGDVNGDGYADLVVGEPYSTNTASNDGAVYVFTGSSSGLSTSALVTLYGSKTTSSYFGWAVDITGDVDKNGYDDVLVGEPGYSTNTGRAWVFKSTSSGPDAATYRNVVGTATNVLNGYSVSGGGDVDLDGYDDFAVGQPGYDSSTYSDNGRALHYKGKSTFFTTTLSATRTLTFSGSSTDQYKYGYSVCLEQSLDANDYADLFVGAPYGASTRKGRVYAYYAALSSGTYAIPTGADSTTDGPTVGSWFGGVVAALGDTDANGYEDLAIGAPDDSSGAGTVVVYKGRSSYLSSTGQTNSITGSAGAAFGFSVSGAGDVNGDGYDDMLVGAPEVSTDYGAAYLYYGGKDDDADGYVINGSGLDQDCNDSNASINPGASEVWYDGVDQDCAGDDDYDQDADGYYPTSLGGTDCDDTNASTYPGAPDAWYDGVDANCDGANDFDQDGDGGHYDAYGGTDCNDTDATIYEGAPDAWYDGIDSDCAGNDDYDQDADGYASDAYSGTDCDDTLPAVNPGATETWYDGVDGNCDNADDYDQDGDGDRHESYGGGDCDDVDASIYGGAPDTWYDGIDSDCAGNDDYDQDGDAVQAKPYGTDCDDTDGAASYWLDCYARLGQYIVIDEDASYTGDTGLELLLYHENPSITEMCIGTVYATCTDWQPYATSSTYTIAEVSGTWTLYARFRDAYGAVSDASSDSIEADFAAPSNGTVTATGASGQIQLDWGGFEDTRSGIGGFTVTQAVGSSPDYFCTGTPIYTGGDTTLLVTGLVDGTLYGFRVCATDSVGNTSSGSAVLARPAPEYDTPVGSIDIADGAEWTNDRSVDIDLSASDPSGTAVSTMCVYNLGELCVDEAYATTRALELTAGVDGIRTVNARFTDGWGNTADDVSDTIGLDTEAPTDGTATAEGGDQQVRIDWTGGSDSFSGVDEYIVRQVEGGAASSCTAGVEVYSGTDLTFTSTGLDNGTTYGFRVCAVDAAGNVSSGTTASSRAYIELDPPTDPSVSIDGGAEWTNSTTVRLSLSAVEANVLESMCVSNKSTCTSWVAYAAAKTHRLGGSGATRTVYAKFRDDSGNESATASDSIGYDAVRPTDGSITAATASGGIDVSWSGFSDATSGVARYVVTISAAGASGAPTSCLRGTPVYSGSGSSTSISGLAEFKRYGVRVCAVDNAGNYSTGKSATVVAGSSGGGFGS